MRTEADLYRGTFKNIVVNCMIEMGHNPNNCFDCYTPLTDKTRQIHHLKYDAATIRDLRFGCSRCNNDRRYHNLV